MAIPPIKKNNNFLKNKIDNQNNNKFKIDKHKHKYNLNTNNILSEYSINNIYSNEIKDINSKNKINFNDSQFENNIEIKRTNIHSKNKILNPQKIENNNIKEENFFRTLKELRKIINNKEKKSSYIKIKKPNCDESIKHYKHSKDKFHEIINNNNRILKNKLKLSNNFINKSEKNNKIHNIKTKNNVKKYLNFNSFKLKDEVQDMDYEKAIIYDKRSYLSMYWAFLIESQIILGTFCTENYLYLFNIKLSFFIFNFQISFFLNALFYTDEYISDAYHNDGVLDFISGLPKSIYSFVATLITTNLLKMLSNNENELKKLIREKANDKNYRNLIDKKLTKLRIKIIIYFILVFILNLFFTYYVSAFCAVYRYSQKYWIYGCLESFVIDSIVSIISCIFLAFLRYISLKKKCKCLFKTTEIISIFF